MPAVNLDLPSNTLMLRTSTAVLPMYIRTDEKTYSCLLAIYFGIIFKRNFSVSISLFVYGDQDQREKTVKLKIKILPRLEERKRRCFMYMYF